ncbi:MAG: hypothetical protein GTO23_01105, partial [Nitrososphaeria archaeon]|nr:hypothetical protein [Nitrososphaeria archaeon]
MSYEEASERHLTNIEDIARVAKELSERSLLSVHGERLEASTRQKFNLIYMALKGGASTKTISMS